MDLALTPFIALAGGGLVCAVAAILWAFLRPAAPGNAVLAAVLSAGFAGFTAITIATEGVFPVILNHTSNLWGVQVWWDLLFSLGIAYVLILPRARRRHEPALVDGADPRHRQHRPARHVRAAVLAGACGQQTIIRLAQGLAPA